MLRVDAVPPLTPSGTEFPCRLTHQQGEYRKESSHHLQHYGAGIALQRVEEGLLGDLFGSRFDCALWPRTTRTSATGIRTRRGTHRPRRDQGRSRCRSRRSVRGLHERFRGVPCAVSQSATETYPIHCSSVSAKISASTIANVAPVLRIQHPLLRQRRETAGLDYEEGSLVGGRCCGGCSGFFGARAQACSARRGVGASFGNGLGGSPHHRVAFDFANTTGWA